MLTKLDIEFAPAVSRFEKIIKDFQIRKVVYKTIFRGKGLEFDSYRDFSPEEDASAVDWKASLRSNKLLAKQYVEERDVDVYFVVDCGSGMLFGSEKKLKAEFSAELVSAFSHLIINSDDRPGVLMFSDREKSFVRPGSGKNQFYLILKALADFSNYGGKFSFSQCISYLLNNISSKYSVIILVSDFINLRDYEDNLKRLSSKFETIGIMVRDPLDNMLPDTNRQIIIQDPDSDRQIVVDPELVGKRYSEIVLDQTISVRGAFKDSGVDLLELNTGEDFAVPLAAFLKNRAAESKR